MSNLDSLLHFMQDNRADELRLGTGRPPQMLAGGVPQRLTIAATDDETFRFLLADVLTPEREAALGSQKQIEVLHDAGPLGTFRVLLRGRPDGSGVDAVLRSEANARGKGAEATPPPTTTPVVEPVAPPAPARPEPETESPFVPLSPALLDLLSHAARLKASDLHVAQGEPPRIRVDGIMRLLPDVPSVDPLELFQLTEAAHARLARGISVELSVADHAGGSARVHIYSTSGGIAAAVRLLPPHAPSLSSLHLPVPLEDLIHLPHGLVLVCGASGSGKSTTLAALAQAALDQRPILLVTLEDPIEYVLVPGRASRASLVRRRQIGRDVPSFAAGLRDALREDPDLLLVGELRDADAIQMAMTAAETGHLVLATLHSRSAPSAITRLIDAYPPAQQEQARRQLAESLRVVVAQRLLPRARAAGRVPSLEVLRVNQAASSLIREGKTAQLGTVMQAARGEGMLILERCLAEQVRDGIVTVEAARAAANDAASLALQLGG